MSGIELWTKEYDQTVYRCRTALDEDDLLGALLAVENAQDHTRREVMASVTEWAELVQNRKAQFVHDDDIALRHVLVERMGFQGEAENYHDTSNCRLSDVIATRVGMPIMVSSVWMIVGVMSGIHITGIGLPGHFIVRIGQDRQALFDPFNRGERLSVNRCRQMVKRLGVSVWNDEFLDAVSNESIVARVCRNLMVGYERKNQGLELYRQAHFLAQLFPNVVEQQMLYARVCEGLQLEPIAISAYQNVIDCFPDNREAQHARSALTKLNGEILKWH